MSLDYQQLHQQVKEMGENAPRRERELQDLRQQAYEQLEAQAERVTELRAKVERAAAQVPTLRCARPEVEALTACRPLPKLPVEAILIAADGSQITPDRHAPVEYYLVNVGAIQLQLGSNAVPETFVESRLYYDEELYTRWGSVSESSVALKRDLRERAFLAERVQQLQETRTAGIPVVTLTDGPLELWGAKDSPGSGEGSFRESLESYKRSLHSLDQLGASTAGYVDKPRADLVVRLLELAMLDENQLERAGQERQLRGVTDTDLFRKRLAPGERSAVFGLQSQSHTDYTGSLALHFFYLNVGRPGHSWLARVEIPAWVARDEQKLDDLHAVLIQQSQVLGSRTFPYILHRAHEAAVVTRDEKEQLTLMISLELRRRGLEVGQGSEKQQTKDLAGRTRYQA